MKNLLKTMAVAAVAVLGLVGAARADGERYVFIEHSPDSDSWWNTIKNALNNAEKEFGVTVEFRNPPTGDIGDMARIVEQAAASNPTGSWSLSLTLTL
jgi:simple sugar transport system substrate-binding protein